MASTRITKEMAHNIASAAVYENRHGIEAEFRKREAALADEVYNKLVLKTPAVKRWVESAPKDWLCTEIAVRVRTARGYMDKLRFSDDPKEPKRRPMTAESSRGGHAQIPAGELSDKVEAFMTDVKAHREKLYTAFKQLEQTILEARSLQKLQVAWPEGAQFYAKYVDAETKTGTALTVPFAEINKVLGIPAKDKKEEKKPRAKRAA